MFTRGGESDYNLVLIDGVRVNQSGGVFDFSRINAAEIERVEVVRGAQSSLWGSDAMGSVVQIFTRRAGAGDRPQVSASTEGGSFGDVPRRCARDGRRVGPGRLLGGRLAPAIRRRLRRPAAGRRYASSRPRSTAASGATLSDRVAAARRAALDHGRRQVGRRHHLRRPQHRRRLRHARPVGARRPVALVRLAVVRHGDLQLLPLPERVGRHHCRRAVLDLRHSRGHARTRSSRTARDWSG